MFPVTMHLLVNAMCQFELMPTCVYMNGYLKWEKLIYFVVFFFFFFIYILVFVLFSGAKDVLYC